jgi:hypothetical protein
MTAEGISIDLFQLDELPPRCEVVVGIELHLDSGELWARFRAIDARTRMSPWSGWFLYEGEPIELAWLDLWSPKHSGPPS